MSVVELYCECGKALGEGESGEWLTLPECDLCNKVEANVWPTTDVLLAVYGAPYNWPCEPAAA
jgi:hypothetical protein